MQYCRTDFRAVPTCSEPEVPVESALPDNQRAVLIRAKMNVAPQGLFVDSLFIDICGQIDSMGVRARAAIALVPAKAGRRFGFPLARE